MRDSRRFWNRGVAKRETFVAFGMEKFAKRETLVALGILGSRSARAWLLLKSWSLKMRGLYLRMCSNRIATCFFVDLVFYRVV